MLRALVERQKQELKTKNGSLKNVMQRSEKKYSDRQHDPSAASCPEETVWTIDRDQ